MKHCGQACPVRGQAGRNEGVFMDNISLPVPERSLKQLAQSIVLLAYTLDRLSNRVFDLEQQFCEHRRRRCKPRGQETGERIVAQEVADGSGSNRF